VEYKEGLESAAWEVDKCADDYITTWMKNGLKGDLQDLYALAVRYSIQEVSYRRGVDKDHLEQIYKAPLSAGANTPTTPPPTITPPSGGEFFHETDK